MNPIFFYESGKKRVSLMPVAFNQFGNFVGSAKWASSCLAPNGNIYFIPYIATQILELNPVTKVTTLFGDFTAVASSRWVGGILAPNGKIYCIPYNATQVLEIDPNTKTTVLFGNLVGSTKWQGGALGVDGKIYGIPSSSSTVLEITPGTNTTSLFGAVAGGGTKYNGGTLGTVGNSKDFIYGFGSVLTTLLINTVNKTAGGVNNISGASKWWGGVSSPNGKGYGIPYSFDKVSVLDYDNAGSTSTFGSLTTASTKWKGGVLGRNGRVYGIPYSSTSLLEITPGPNNINLYGGFSSVASGWSGGTLAPNGNIYCAPYNATTILEILGTNVPDAIGADALIPSDLATLPTSNYNRYYNKC